jgi:hypothetical protein
MPMLSRTMFMFASQCWRFSTPSESRTTPSIVTVRAPSEPGVTLCVIWMR